MPSIDCPNCDGSGYTADASGQRVVCPVCDGTGTQFREAGTAHREGGASAKHRAPTYARRDQDEREVSASRSRLASQSSLAFRAWCRFTFDGCA